MQTATLQHPATSAAHNLPTFPPLELENRSHVGTEQAAYYLNRRPQTLRAWACLQPAGTIRPVRINGRLAWRLTDIIDMLNGELA